MQERLDQDLEAVTKKYSSTMNQAALLWIPKTGEIIAMGSSYPSFDPNDFQNENPEYFGNPNVEREYEFGSIVKSLTMAEGLDAGVITPTETYDDTGSCYPSERCNGL